MFIKIEDDYINMDLVIDICPTSEGGCKVCFINKLKSTFEISADEFMREFEKQATLPINKMIVKPTIKNRFELMDFEK